MRPKPMVGDHITLLPDFGDPVQCVVLELLAMMFTVSRADWSHGGTMFLYYDRLKGDSWEFTKYATS